MISKLTEEITKLNESMKSHNTQKSSRLDKIEQSMKQENPQNNRENKNSAIIDIDKIAYMKKHQNLHTHITKVININPKSQKPIIIDDTNSTNEKSRAIVQQTAMPKFWKFY